MVLYRSSIPPSQRTPNRRPLEIRAKALARCKSPLSTSPHLQPLPGGLSQTTHNTTPMLTTPFPDRKTSASSSTATSSANTSTPNSHPAPQEQTGTISPPTNNPTPQASKTAVRSATCRRNVYNSPSAIINASQARIHVWARPIPMPRRVGRRVVFVRRWIRVGYARHPSLGRDKSVEYV